jgi:hypothetical protein
MGLTSCIYKSAQQLCTVVHQSALKRFKVDQTPHLNYLEPHPSKELVERSQINLEWFKPHPGE